MVGELLAYLVFRAVLFPFQVLPLTASRALGGLLGLVVYTIAPIRKAIVTRNVRFVFPELAPREVKKLVRAAYVHTGYGLADFAFGTRFHPGNVDRYIRCEGVEHYRAAHATGKQVILYSNHQAMWEWCQCVRHWGDGESVYCIGKRIHNRFIDGFVKRKRNIFGVEMISQRGAIHSLKERGAADPTANYAFFVDQRAAKGKGVWIDVAGRPVSAMPGPAIMALRGNLPIVPTQLVRTDFGMILRFNPPLDFTPSGDEAHDIQRLTQLINDQVLGWINHQPESYFWLHNRFKVHPAEREQAEEFRQGIASGRYRQALTADLAT